MRGPAVGEARGVPAPPGHMVRHPAASNLGSGFSGGFVEQAWSIRHHWPLVIHLDSQ